MKSTEYCRYRRFALLILVSLPLLATACLDEMLVSLCPDGKLVIQGDIQICVTGVVTQTGFLCEDLLPHRYHDQEEILCSNHGDLADDELSSALDRTVDEGYERTRVPVPQP